MVGLLVNGDFIMLDRAGQKYEPVRYSIDRCLELLREAGFKVPKSFIQLKQNIVDSTVIQK